MKNNIEVKPLAAIILSLLIVATSFAAGYFYNKSRVLGTVTTQPSTLQNNQAVQGPVPSSSPVSMNTIKSLFSGNLVSFGDSSRKLLITEVSDPSCPYCHVADGINTTIGPQIGNQFVTTDQGGSYIAPLPELRKLVEANKASYVWIYYPGHGNGEMGAKALYCANEQGKFWQVHDLLMSAAGYTEMNTQILNDKSKSKDLASFLVKAADPQKLQSCLDSGKYDARLSSDTQLAGQLGINATPAFFLNDKLFLGAYGWTEMQSTAQVAEKS